MKKHLFLFAAIFLTGFSAFTQNAEQGEKKTTVKTEWAGHIAIAKDIKSNVFLNVGGPSLKLGFGLTALTLGFCPSLKYNFKYDEKTDKTPLAPILGSSVMISRGHFIAGCVFYSIKNLWYAAPSVGYKFK